MHAIGLTALLASCAPSVGPITMRAIVQYESGARPFAIGDNTSRRSYFPPSREAAAALAASLLGAGHNIDAGYAQVNSANFRPYGMSAVTAFDPCLNLRVASAILRHFYARSIRSYGPGQRALRHALSAYNSGSYFAGLSYARGVYQTAASLRAARLP